jgi:hypothetical protein
LKPDHRSPQGRGRLCCQWSRWMGSRRPGTVKKTEKLWLLYKNNMVRAYVLIRNTILETSFIFFRWFLSDHSMRSGMLPGSGFCLLLNRSELTCSFKS